MIALESRSHVRNAMIAGLLILALSGIVYLQATGADVTNPHGNFWRVVRDGVPAYSSTPQQGHTILIVNGGENWREIRNGFIMRLSQWFILIVLVTLAFMYRFIGPDRLEEQRSGIAVKRHAKLDRIVHWYTAFLFIAMGLTGLSILLGRLLLIPIIGHTVDSAWLITAKVIHNYCGPLLLAGFALELSLWVKFNIPKKYDLEWIKKMTKQLKGHAHIGKVNAGQKAWFWLVMIFGTAVGITGVILDFPIWGQSRNTMQVSHVIHAVVAIIFVGVSLGHMYLGSIGTEGVFEGMWKGTVDKVWALQHSDLWYEETLKKQPGGNSPAAAKSPP